ncbi:hypothetical protein AVEN_186156-1 [Araneus ventricosus]|uniref:Pre-C2HC domain-containing protein n=1 Tax=Araneus ventricosus TaxID=182803 RepID=A0A4Y2DV58_ARAVE|nr:hypothetical protein AVEN_186156-1 [Araneus ventricosus]
MRTKTSQVKIVEAMLSRAPRSHQQDDDLMKKLNQLDDSENITDLRTRAQERLQELEKTIKDDQARWFKESGLEDEDDDEIKMDLVDSQTPISFDVSFITGNSIAQTKGTTTISEEILHENSGVASVSPVVEITTPTFEDEFKTQGKRRRSNKSQMDEDKMVKKKPNIVTTAPTTNNSKDPGKIPSREMNIPPVVIKNFPEFKFLMKRLNETKNLKCCAKPVGEFMHVFTNSSKDHRDLTDYLTEQSIQYYVIPSRAEKPVKIVIKGLPIDTKTDEIEEGLNSKGFEVAKVNQLRRFRDKKPLDIFQVHLLKSDNLKDIYKLDNLNYFIISVEKYERKTVG